MRFKKMDEESVWPTVMHYVGLTVRCRIVFSQCFSPPLAMSWFDSSFRPKEALTANPKVSTTNFEKERWPGRFCTRGGILGFGSWSRRFNGETVIFPPMAA